MPCRRSSSSPELQTAPLDCFGMLQGKNKSFHFKFSEHLGGRRGQEGLVWRTAQSDACLAPLGSGPRLRLCVAEAFLSAPWLFPAARGGKTVTDASLTLPSGRGLRVEWEFFLGGRGGDVPRTTSGCRHGDDSREVAACSLQSMTSRVRRADIITPTPTPTHTHTHTHTSNPQTEGIPRVRERGGGCGAVGGVDYMHGPPTHS